MTGVEARERIVALLKADPSLTQSELARRVGVTKQRVSQLVKKVGLQAGVYEKPRDLNGERIPAGPPRIMVQTSVDTGPVNATVAGTIAELVVAADLLARGWQVFFPMVRTTKCDLLATDKTGERVIRVEVRSGRRVGESITFLKKDKAVCDHYAIVVPREPVTYKPEL